MGRAWRSGFTLASMHADVGAIIRVVLCGVMGVVQNLWRFVYLVQEPPLAGWRVHRGRDGFSAGIQPGLDALSE